jgi:regulator of replication initiation timing
MRKEIYENIINLAQNFNNLNAFNILKQQIGNKNIFLTLKNYKLEKGLSMFIHGDSIKK